MSMSIGGATVAVIESGRQFMRCDAFPSKLAAVLAMIDNGSIGGGLGYGGDEHKAALAEIEQQIVKTRACIAEQEARDARLDAEAKAPPCQECGAMTAEESETKCHGSGDDCHGCRLWPSD